MAAEIISTITSTITSFLTAVASNIVTVFNAVAVTADGKLTDFAIWALVFLGVGFGTTVLTAILRKVG